MLVIGFAVSLFLFVSLLAPVHGLGLWLLLLITHGIVVAFLGEVAMHLPFYSGLAVVASVLVRRQWTGVDIHTASLFAMLLVVMSVAAVQGLNMGVSMLSIMLYLKVFLLALLVAGCLKSEKDLRVMLQYCLAGMLLGALYALYQYLTNTFTINELNSQRAAGLRGDPNDTAMLLVAGIPIAIYYFVNSKRLFYKIFLLGSLALLLVGVVLTQSRGGLVALLFVLFLIYIRRPTVMSSLMGLVMVAFVFAVAPASYWERMQTLVYGEQHSGFSMSSRVTLLSTGLKTFVDNPAFGVGAGNFGNLSELNSSGFKGIISSNVSSAENPGKKAVAHNMYLEFFVENGFFGGIILLIIFYLAVYRLLIFDRYNPDGSQLFTLGFATAVAILGMLFAGLFLSQGKSSVLWFMIGLGLAAGQIAMKNKRLNSERADEKSPEQIV